MAVVLSQNNGTLESLNLSSLRPTKSNVDNFDDNYDFNGKVIVIGLRVKRFDNFMPRVMRKRLRVNFHNFFITSPCPRIVNHRVSFA